MSIFKKKLANQALQANIVSLNAAIIAQGGSLVDPSAATVAFATESASEVELGNLESQVQSVNHILGEFVDGNEFALESAAGVLFAAASPDNFYGASRVYTPSASDIQANEANFSLEGYQDRDYSKFIAHSVFFNTAASTQDDLGEGFFPTVLVNAQAPILVSELRSTVITKEVRHALTGEVTDTQDRNIALASTDYTLLDSESTRVYPAVAADNSNLDKFVSATLYPAKDINVDGATVKVAPLKIGKDLNIMGLASNAANLDGATLDISDVLDNRVVLDSVVVKVTNVGVDGVEGGGDDTVSVIEIPVGALPRAAFLRGMEGSNNELSLSFKNRGFALNTATKDIAGNPVPALVGLISSESLTLNLELFGSVNMRTSNMRVSAAATQVDRVFDGDVELSTTAGAGQVIVDALLFEVIGYTIDAVRTNANRRSIGLSIDTRSNNVVWNIGSTAPLYNRAPTTAAADDGDVVDNLIRAARQRTAINAVTALLKHVDNVSVFTADGKGVPASEVFKGAADEVIPYYKSIPLDVQASINSISTAEKTADLRGLLADTISHEIALMAQASNYLTALEMASNGNEKLRVIIGTDPIIHTHLMASGDDRTFGEGVEYKIVSTNDVRMKGKIIVSFQRASAKGFGPLSLGGRGYIPELLGTAQVSRNGQTSNELIVQPRELHVAVLPVILELNVTKLTELLSSKV